MSKLKKSDEFVAAWQRLSEETPFSVKQIVGALIQQHAADLADMFYTHMLADDEARTFLDNDIVNQRLHTSLQNWLSELFLPESKDLQEIFKHQCRIGLAAA